MSCNVIFNGANNGNTREALVQPIANRLCERRINSDDHTTAHIEGSMHFLIGDIALLLNPTEFWKNW